MSRSRKKLDLGSAISLEDALSIMVVTFVLFVLFLIPLINIDRMKLDKAKKDTYWEKAAAWITECSSNQEKTDPYLQGFNLGGQKLCFTKASDTIIIEALSPTGDLTIIRHIGNGYISCLVTGQSAAVAYRMGTILWSSREQEWFTENNTIDYGEKEAAREMQKAYREWTRLTRGY